MNNLIATCLDKINVVCQNVIMAKLMTNDEVAVRRTKVLVAARWCFLNFGFSKTSFEDIARRANLSRTLLYRIFNTKDEIYQAVFLDWLVARHPAATQAARGSGSRYERLLSVCRLMVFEPWVEMVNAPMGQEFIDACERIDPESDALYRKVVRENVAYILDDEASAEVFLLALDGLLADQPSVNVLEQRTQLLAGRFASYFDKKEMQS
ncbi:MAG: TetR/AcrR family transcriptional regulator [Rhodoferax sp.]